jgi:putative endonuclease
MSEERKSLGKKGEDLAASYLKKNQGYKILHRNYRCVFGEIDIIAKDQDVLSFVEVKTRSSAGFGIPQESVNKRKQHQLSKVALEFINRHKAHNMKARFDVVAVYLDPQEERMELIKDAFEVTIH